MGLGDVRPGRADGGKLVARWRLRLPYFLEIRNPEKYANPEMRNPGIRKFP